VNGEAEFIQAGNVQTLRMYAFRPTTTGWPLIMAVVAWFPWELATTSVFPLALGVGSCRSISMVRTLPLIVTFMVSFLVFHPFCGIISEDKISSYTASLGLILLFWMMIWEIPILFLSSVIDMPEAGVVIASAFLGASVGKLLSGPAIKPDIITASLCGRPVKNGLTFQFTGTHTFLLWRNRQVSHSLW